MSVSEIFRKSSRSDELWLQRVGHFVRSAGLQPLRSTHEGTYKRNETRGRDPHRGRELCPRPRGRAPSRHSGAAASTRGGPGGLGGRRPRPMGYICPASRVAARRLCLSSRSPLLSSPLLSVALAPALSFSSLRRCFWAYLRCIPPLSLSRPRAGLHSTLPHSHTKQPPVATNTRLPDQGGRICSGLMMTRRQRRRVRGPPVAVPGCRVRIAARSSPPARNGRLQSVARPAWEAACARSRLQRLSRPVFPP
jgi:hypothetical protein